MLERPFVPRSKANQLSSFLVARNDPAHYGQLVLYQMPTDSVAPSPSRAASLIEANPVISKQFSLLDQRGSSVIRGHAQLVPDRQLDLLRPADLREGQGVVPALELRRRHLRRARGARLDERRRRREPPARTTRSRRSSEPGGGPTLRPRPDDDPRRRRRRRRPRSRRAARRSRRSSPRRSSSSPMAIRRWRTRTSRRSRPTTSGQ